MAEQILIEVGIDAGNVASQLADVSARLQGLKEAQKELTKEYKAGNVSAAEYATNMQLLKDETGALTAEQKGLIAQQRLATATANTYSDSLNGQRKRLSDLQKAYDELGEEMRNSDAGQAFRDEIKKQHDAVLELEGATGRMQRNVGNYPQVVQSIIPGFDKVTAVLGKMGVSMGDVQAKGAKAFSGLGQSAQAFGKAFLTPPIAVITIVLSAIVLAVTKVVDAFKKNDDAMTALQRAFSAIQPVLNVINKAFSLLAETIANTVIMISKAVTAVLSLIPAYKQAAEEADKLVVAQDRLEESERQYTENSARRNRDIARLRDEAAAAGDPSVRMKKMREAIDLEAKNLEEEKRIKAEQLRILLQQAKQEADTSDEMKNKIAQARAAMYQAEEAYYTGTRRLQAQLRSAQEEITREEEAKAKAAAEEAKRRQEEARRRAEDHRKKMEAIARKQAETHADLIRQSEDWAVEAMDEGLDKQIAQARLAGQREVEELRKRLKDKESMTAENRRLVEGLILQSEARLAKEEERLRKEAAEKEKQEAEERAKNKADLARETARAVLTAGYDEETATAEERKEYLRQQHEAEVAEATARMEEELAQADLDEESKQLIRDKWHAVAVASEREFQSSLNEIDAKSAAEQKKLLEDKAKAIAGLFGTMSQMLKEYGGKSKEAAVASKALAIGEIAVNQGIAIAKGVAQAQAVPFPANIAAIATTVTTILSTILQATKAVQSAEFAEGGIVPGRYDARDSVRASLSGGELVLNPAQQKNLYDIANIGLRTGNAEVISAAMSEALRDMPAPVMDYAEFTDFQQNTTRYNEIARI